MGPLITFEERHVPVDGGAKFGIVAGFGPTQAAISNVEIQLRLGGHAAKNRGHILDRVAGQREDAKGALRHVDTRRRVNGIAWRKAKTSARWLPSGKVYPVSPARRLC